MATNVPIGVDTPVSVKITYQGVTKKIKLPLGELGPNTLPSKLKGFLAIPEDKQVVFERFSDSAGAYITLHADNVQAYKTLYRAAKAKLKLRLRATVPGEGISLPVMAPSPFVPSPSHLRSSLRQRSSKLSLNPAFSASEATLNNPVGGVRVSGGPSSVTLPESTVEAEDEAPVPQPFSARDHFFQELAGISRARELALRMKPSPLAVPGCAWSVYCNNCDLPMPDEHYHCNVCDNGDYDLCANCVSEGKHCKSDAHWMIKRSVKNGKVINSTTERIAPQPKSEVEKKLQIPGAYAEEKKPEPEVVPAPTRTCNSCVKVFNEDQFVTCQTCDDYDLCIACHCSNKHGHHPGHAFKSAVEGATVGPLAAFLMASGRNVRHAALCDGCDKHIYGVRHKCLNCPDWDFCSTCVAKAPSAHPGHRFVAIYDPLPDVYAHSPRHYGIYCDGPLCNTNGPSKTYIAGVRYKCAICNDTDFCANCEASPANKHNRTHPLIKFKTPVRNVSVTTMGEDRNGAVMATMGDSGKTASGMRPCSSVSKVQPIVDVKPVEEAAPKPVEKIEIKDLLAEPIKEKIKVQDLLSTPVAPIMNVGKMPVNAPTAELNAHFIRDTVTDGTPKLPNERFVQTWTLKNPGPHAWPAGCSVRYVGGDNMLNVQDSSAPGVADAVSSNIINRVVNVGEEVAFRVVMKAPLREGTSISYWRLKSHDGTPFGHRLWCHINVTKIVEPLQAPAEAPKVPSPDTEMLRLLEEFNKKRQATNDALKKTEMRVKQLEEIQKTKQVLADEQDRQKRVQMLRALHAARLAAVSAEKKEMAASMKPKIEEVAEVPAVPVLARSPPAPTVEDAPEKEEEGKLLSAPQVKAEEPLVKSTMIFPKLEKESPTSSVHDVASSSDATAVTAAEAAATETNTEAPTSPATEEIEIFEDAESVEIVSESESDDDGFLTDEEYDILDASDEELGL